MILQIQVKKTRQTPPTHTHTHQTLSPQLSDAGPLAAIPLGDFPWLIELMLHLLVLTWEPCSDILVLSDSVGSPSQDTHSIRQRGLAWFIFLCI